MKHTLTRTWISAILCIALLASSALLLASCNKDGSDQLTYALNADGTGYTVTGCEKKNAKEITVPDTYNGLPVVEIGEKAFFNSNLNSLVLPEGLEKIGEKAFAGNANIQTLDIPDSVTYIAKDAFGLGNYGSVSYLRVENGVVYCDDWVVASEDAVSVVVLREGTVGIAAEAFCEKDSLTKITLSDALLYICDEALSECEGLTEVQSGDNTRLKLIGKYAFSDCPNLSTVTLHIVEGMEIADNAFYNCPALENAPSTSN